MFKRIFPFLLLTAAVAVLYGHTLGVPFYLDDHFAVDGKPTVKNLHLAFSYFFEKRGLSTLSFAVNYRLHGFEVFGYHLVNILIHIGSVCLVLVLLRRLFPQKPQLQLCGALLFACHPLQTQAVTYIVQRMTSLSALLFLLALYLFVLARERLAAGRAFTDRVHLACYGGALLAGALAIMAKENAVVLPLVLLLFAWLLRPAGGLTWKSALGYVAPFCLAPLAAGIGYFVIPQFFGRGLNAMGVSADMRSMSGNSPLAYFVTQCQVLWIYIRMLFIPYGQAVDHGYPVSRELLNLPSLLGGAGLAGLMALGWWLRQRLPLVACGIAWFFITLSVESSFIPLDPLFEHRLYLPMFGFVIIVLAGLERVPRPAWQYALMAVLILSLGVAAWHRNNIWNDPVALYKQDLRVSPQNERAMFNLAEAYRTRGLWAEAEQTFRECIRLNPNVEIIYQGLTELYKAQGRTADLVGMLRYAVKNIPRSGLLATELGFAYAKQGDLRSALVMLHRAVELSPRTAEAYYNLAEMYQLAGDWEQTAVYLDKTLRLHPGHFEAQRLRAELRRRNLSQRGEGGG